MKKTVWLLQAGLFYAFTLSVALLPLFLADRLGRLLGLAFARVLPKRRAIALDNIRASLPFMEGHPRWGALQATATAIAREMFANLGRSLIETCQIYHGKSSHIFGAIEIRGLAHFDQARLRRKGIMMVSGHCGNWELNLVPILSEEIVSAAQPVGQLFRIAAHYFSQLIQIHPFIPRQSTHSVIGAF